MRVGCDRESMWVTKGLRDLRAGNCDQARRFLLGVRQFSVPLGSSACFVCVVSFVFSFPYFLYCVRPFFTVLDKYMQLVADDLFQDENPKWANPSHVLMANQVFAAGFQAIGNGVADHPRQMSF